MNSTMYGLGLAQLLMIGQVPQEALVVFKDGFYLSGRIMEKTDFIIDKGSGQSFKIGTGLNLDDQVRKIYFSVSQVQDAIAKKQHVQDPIRLKRFGRARLGDQMYPSWQQESVGDWTSKGERDVLLRTARGLLKVEQRLTLLTPDFMGVDAIRYNWTQWYLARELPPEEVRKLARQFADAEKNLTESEKGLLMARFLTQSDFHDLAEKELANLLQNHPEQKEVVKPLQDALKKTKAELYVEGLELAHKVGQHEEAQFRTQVFFKEDWGELVREKQGQVFKLKSFYEEGQTKLKQAQGYLKDLPSLTGDRPFWTEAAAVILNELNLDTLPRLETFLELAKSHENERKAQRKPGNSADEVMAVAVTGWLQDAPEPDVKNAQLLFRARKMVLGYQKDPLPFGRGQLLEPFLKGNELPPDVLARLIRMLPPPDPYEKINTEPFKVDIKVPQGGTGSYLIQLPPEYHHYRPYPVVVLLPGKEEKPLDLMGRWSARAAQQGYILVAPLAGKGLRGQYSYNGKEHAMVLDCLRDLRRRFQVDSDRIFMFGFAEGAEMAFDVGLSHPDQFAGVLTMCAGPRLFASSYWPNAQYLPFYMVEGEMNAQNTKSIRTVTDLWKRWGYPYLYLEYKGRFSEWFGGELQTMFEWMNRKKRLNPVRQLGREREEIRSMRETDNRFYWLSTEHILPRCLNDAAKWNNLAAQYPARMTGIIRTGNELTLKKEEKIWSQIDVDCFGLKQITIWLSPGQIDFKKDVLVRINGVKMGPPKMISPDLTTLMEDFYHQGDRNRLFFARIDLKW